MSLFGFVGATFCVRLTNTLVHFLWQGMAIGLLAVVTEGLLRRSSSRARYGVYVLALLLMVASPLATFWVVGGPGSAGSRDAAEPAPSHVASARPHLLEAPKTLPSSDVTLTPEAIGGHQAMTADLKPEVLRSDAERTSGLRRYAPHAATCYLAGVVLMLGRLLAALHGGKRLRRSAAPVTDSAILASLTRGAKAFGLSVAPAIAYCRRVAVPTVVGILRPTVLLPLSLASGLSPEQVEMSLLHELAHIRRYDHLVNVIQGVIEAVLFFHPAVWFVSRRIRIERENCCDDMVVAAGGMPLTYASSLVEIAALGRQHQKALLATISLHAARKPSHLRQRVLRLLGDSAHEHVRLKRGWGVGLAMAVLAALAVAVCLQGPENQAAAAPRNLGPKTHFVRGNFELNREIPIELRAGKEVVGNPEYLAVELESVRFLRNQDRIQASVRVKTASIAQAKWRTAVGLLTHDGRVLGESEAVLETFLHIAGRPGWWIGLLHFTLGPVNDLSEIAQFRIVLERAPDDAEVTANRIADTYPAATAAAKLKESLTIRPEKGTRLITIPYESKDVDTADAGIEAQVMAETLHPRRPEAWHPEASQPGGSARFEGRLELDREVPVELKVGSRLVGDREYFAVEAQGIKFLKNGEHLEAYLHVRGTTVLSAKWRATVELVSDDGRVPAWSEAVFATTLIIERYPNVEDGYLQFSLSRWRDVSEAAKFRVSIERASDDTKVAAELTGNPGPVESSAPPAEKPRPFIVTGTVTDAAGRPMPGVEVCASCGRGSLLPTGNAVSGADGKYTLRFGPGYGSLDKESGEWDFPYQFAVVGAIKPGYYEKNLSWQGNLSIAADAQSVPEGRREPVVFPNQPYQLDFVMLPAATIKGRMVDLEGRPVANQRFVVDGDELLPAASVLRNVTTGEDGRFTVSEVPCKRYWFALVAGGSREIKTDSVEFSQPRTYEVELVYDADKPSLEVTGNHSLEVRVVDSQGKPAGVVLIQLWRPQEPQVGPEQGRGDWRELILWHDDTSGTTWLPDGLHQTRDPTVFEGLLPGEYRISVARVPEGQGGDPSPVGVSEVIQLSPGDKSVQITIRLEGDTPLTLKFFDATDRKPLENAHFVLLRADGFPVGHGRLSSGEDGTFRFAGLIPGTYRLTAGKRAWQYGQMEYEISEDRMRLEVISGRNNIFEVPLQPVELTQAEIEQRWPFVVTGTVTDQEGKPMPGVEVRVNCGMGTLWPTGKALTGADGTYTLRFGAAMSSLDEKSGKWVIGWQFATVRAYKAGYYEKDLSRHGGLSIAGETRLVPENPREPVVIPKQPYRLDFVLLPAATIKGRLVDTLGQPVAKQRIWLSGKELPPSQSVLAGTETDADGRFTIGEIPCRSWWFEFRDKDGREVKTEPFDIPSAGTYGVELSYDSSPSTEPTLTHKLTAVPGGS